MTAIFRYHHTPEELAHHFAYYPETGLLVWQTSGPHHRAGDEAGTITRDGHVWVSLSGHKYPARYIIWALLHKALPTDPVTLLSDGLDLSPTERRSLRQDLRPHNIISRPPVLSQTPRAIALRRKRAQFEAMRAGVPMQLDPHAIVHDPTRHGLRWSAASGLWDVTDDAAAVARLPFPQRPPAQRLLGRCKTLPEARALYDATIRRINYLAANPPPHLAPDARLIMAAGDKYFGITLWEAHETFAYDPATGDLIWRRPPIYAGMRAGKPGATVPALYVSLHGRRYPVHAMAWFLTHGVWPGRKAIGWRNGDQTDNRLSNLYLTGTDT